MGIMAEKESIIILGERKRAKFTPEITCWGYFFI